MADTERFEVTEDHLTLLRRWHPNRMDFGNADYLRDIPLILGWTLFEDHHGHKHLTKPQASSASQLYYQVQTALEIALRTGAFAAGTYEREQFGEWRKVEGEG